VVTGPRMERLVYVREVAPALTSMFYVSGLAGASRKQEADDDCQSRNKAEGTGKRLPALKGREGNQNQLLCLSRLIDMQRGMLKQSGNRCSVRRTCPVKTFQVGRRYSMGPKQVFSCTSQHTVIIRGTFL